MTAKLSKRKNDKVPTALKIFFALVLVGLTADILDMIAYRVFLSNKGIGFWDISGWGYFWEYISGFPGALLTFLGIAPYLIALIYLYLPQRDEDLHI
jgi:hypothetical protein